MTKPTLLKEVPIFTTGGACEKPIAERFDDYILYRIKKHPYAPIMTRELVKEWLKQQPENNQELVTTEQAHSIAKETLVEFIKDNKLFTLEEVEAIAREVSKLPPYINSDNWIEEKLKELSKWNI